MILASVARDNENAEADADELFREIEARRDEQVAVDLAVAKERQHAEGKEPFDLDILERTYDTSTEAGSLASRGARHRQYEESYYLLYPEVMTLEEYAKAKAQNDLWRT